MSPRGAEAAYFIRNGPHGFAPTSHVGGGWDPDEQHIAPSVGLLAHLIEADHAARRGEALNLTRLSVDILGTLRMAPVEVGLRLVRAGRTIELVEANIVQDGRTAVSARGWLCATYDTTAWQGSPFPPLKPRAEMPAWDMTQHWPGGFVRSARIWREVLAKGRVRFWLRSDVQLLEAELVSPTAHVLRLIDVANGVAARAAPEALLYPNLDLTVHLFRRPAGELTGLDTTASFGPEGGGLTSSVLHDELGPFGVSSQTLTVRPR